MTISGQQPAQQEQQQRLYENQAYWIWLARDSMLLAARGGVRIERAAVIDGACSREISLHEGECHTLESAGWICLRAGQRAQDEDFAEVVCISPPPAASGLRRLVAKWRGRWSAWGTPAAR